MTGRRLVYGCALATTAITVAAAMACQGPGPYPPVAVPTERNWVSNDELMASQLSIGLRITPERSGEESVRVVAVVYGADGAESVSDLGVYPGRAAPQAPTGDALVGVAIESARESNTVRLFRIGDYIEARRRGAATIEGGDRGELIRRIPVPGGAPVEPRTPPVEVRQ
jgi:hypothetical protein